MKPEKEPGMTGEVVVVQLPSHIRLFATPWIVAHQASLSLSVSQSLPKFVFIALVMPSSHLIFWHPLLLLSLIFRNIRDFPNEWSSHIRWPKYWSFSFTISPSSEYFGSISLLSEGLSGVLQHHNSKASIFWHLPSSQSSSRNHWEDHSLDCADLCWHSNVSITALNVTLKITLNRYFLRILEAGNLR